MRISPMEIQVFKVKKVQVPTITDKSGNHLLRRKFLPCWMRLRRKIVLKKSDCPTWKPILQTTLVTCVQP